MAMQNSNKTYRQVDKIHAAPRPHWVGDGFHVNPMFNHMVGDKRTDPFLMLDYAAKQYFEPNAQAPRGVGQHPHKGFETVTMQVKSPTVILVAVAGLLRQVMCNG